MPAEVGVGAVATAGNAFLFIDELATTAVHGDSISVR
jgi:hypothetical protein